MKSDVPEQRGDLDPPAFNPFDAEYRKDPYTVLDRIRQSHPILSSDFGFYLVSTYEDVRSVLTSSKFGLSEDAGSSRFPPNSVIGRVCQDAFLFKNPPDHGRLRSLVNRALSPRRVRLLEQSVVDTAEELFRGLPREGEVDIVSEIAKPLPLAVICDLVGIAREDRERVGVLSDALCPTLDPVVTDDQVPALDEAVSEFGDLVLREAGARRVRPQDDLLTTLDLARSRGETTDGELVASCVLILAAGHATTENAIASTIFHLLRTPEELKSVRADETMIPMAVEEALRFESPIAMFLRWATEAVEIRGTTIGEGEVVALHIGAANRDPAFFEEPSRYALEHRETPHIAFGAGIHSCPGAPLVRAETAVAVRLIANGFEEIELLGSQDWKPTVTVRGLESLEVGFSKRRSREPRE